MEKRAPRRNRKSNGSDPFAVALKLLTFRDRSIKELSTKLRDRGFADEEIEATLQRCQEYGYLDDRRFAATRARTLVSSGRAVGIRAINDLTRVGIDRPLSEEMVATAEEETDLPELLAGILDQKYPGFAFEAASDNEKNRVVSFFRRRGFPVSLILDVLKSRNEDF